MGCKKCEGTVYVPLVAFFIGGDSFLFLFLFLLLFTCAASTAAPARDGLGTAPATSATVACPVGATAGAPALALDVSGREMGMNSEWAPMGFLWIFTTRLGLPMRRGIPMDL